MNLTKAITTSDLFNRGANSFKSSYSLGTTPPELQEIEFGSQRKLESNFLKLLDNNLSDVEFWNEVVLGKSVWDGLSFFVDKKERKHPASVILNLTNKRLLSLHAVGTKLIFQGVSGFALSCVVLAGALHRIMRESKFFPFSDEIPLGLLVVIEKKYPEFFKRLKTVLKAIDPENRLLNTIRKNERKFYGSPLSVKQRNLTSYFVGPFGVLQGKELLLRAIPKNRRKVLTDMTEISNDICSLLQLCWKFFGNLIKERKEKNEILDFFCESPVNCFCILKNAEDYETLKMMVSEYLKPPEAHRPREYFINEAIAFLWEHLRKAGIRSVSREVRNFINSMSEKNVFSIDNDPNVSGPSGQLQVKERYLVEKSRQGYKVFLDFMEVLFFRAMLKTRRDMPLT